MARDCRPIVNDFNRGAFTCTRNGLTFYFSSMKHLERFCTYVREREDYQAASLYKRFKVRIDADIMADIQYYVTVEGNGFRIVDEDGEVYECLEELELTGLKPVRSSSGHRSVSMSSGHEYLIGTE